MLQSATIFIEFFARRHQKQGCHTNSGDSVIAYLRRPRLLRLVVSGWLAVWLAVASIWPLKDYIVRIALPAEQRLVLNEHKLGDLIPTGAAVLTFGGWAWWALGSDRAVYDSEYSDLQDLDRNRIFRDGRQWHWRTRGLVSTPQPPLRCDGARTI